MMELNVLNMSGEGDGKTAALRILLNGLITGGITTLTILMTVPYADITTSFLTSAVMAGGLVALREFEKVLKEAGKRGRLYSLFVHVGFT